MKTLSITLLFAVVCSVSASGQSFEGTIIYTQDVDVSASMKKMGVTQEMLRGEMKKNADWSDTLKAYYKQGDYTHISSNAELLTKIYISSENKIYTFKVKGDDMCAVQEAVDLGLSGQPDKPTVTELDSTVTVMGLPCKIIRMKWSIGRMDYYYNASQAKVNPDLFSKHSAEGLAEFVKRAKCLPLRTVLSAMGAEIIKSAAVIKPGKVSPDLFKLPTLVDDESLNAMKMPGIVIKRVKR